MDPSHPNPPHAAVARRRLVVSQPWAVQHQRTCAHLHHGQRFRRSCLLAVRDGIIGSLVWASSWDWVRDPLHSHHSTRRFHPGRAMPTLRCVASIDDLAEQPGRDDHAQHIPRRGARPLGQHVEIQVLDDRARRRLCLLLASW
jgi:hypothetical protein